MCITRRMNNIIYRSTFRDYLINITRNISKWIMIPMLTQSFPESKRVGEALCNAYYQTYQLDYVIPRLSRVYGPTMLSSDSKAIAQFIKKAAAGEECNCIIQQIFCSDNICRNRPHRISRILQWMCITRRMNNIIYRSTFRDYLPRIQKQLHNL